MKFHVFNPEHDIALASDLANFTAPHAGRQLRHDLGFLPALWADEGDVVLVDDVELAKRSFQRVAHAANKYLGKGLLRSECQFAALGRHARGLQAQSVEPWGWDRALKARLARAGIDEALLPSDEQVSAIRMLSHRRSSALLLPALRCEGIIGESFECTTVEEVDDLQRRYGRLVLKAPWSSSGRGLRFIHEPVADNPYVVGWLHHLLKAQGSVMAEPYYEKAKDFGMEFEATAEGEVRYLGLSLFHTENGAYKGNILAKESLKNEMLSRYISKDLLESVQQKICALTPSIFKHQYVGPFGVDMMVCTSSNDDGQTTGERHFLLHPCVEINLRRTMGHVALSLTPQDDEIKGVMRIDYDDNAYKLLIKRL